MSNIYERHLGGLGPYVDDEVVFVVSQTIINGKGVTRIKRGDADDDMTDIIVIEKFPVEIRVTSRSSDVVSVKIKRLGQ